jgi:hypothetical protein
MGVFQCGGEAISTDCEGRPQVLPEQAKTSEQIPRQRHKAGHHDRVNVNGSARLLLSLVSQVRSFAADTLANRSSSSMNENAILVNDMPVRAVRLSRRAAQRRDR